MASPDFFEDLLPEQNFNGMLADDSLPKDLPEVEAEKVNTNDKTNSQTTSDEDIDSKDNSKESKAKAAKARDIAEIRRLFFTGIIAAFILLVAMAFRDFIAGIVEDHFPQGGFKNRLMVLVIVVSVSLFLVFLVYEAELDR